jgi:hypothetical protein
MSLHPPLLGITHLRVFNVELYHKESNSYIY